MNIADKFRLLCPATVEETINDQPFTFYQCSPKTLATTAQLVAHLAGSVSTLFADKDADVGTTIQDFRDPETGEEGQTTVINPISVQLAEARCNRRREAIESLVIGVLDADHRKMLLGLIVNSLRDEFDRKNSQQVAEAVEFFDNMDVGPFIKFFMGMMKANARVFGDLGKQMVDRMQQATKAAVDGEGSLPSDLQETAG